MPILDPHTLEIFSRSPGQTKRIGMRLGSLLKPGDLVCLTGEMGSGKTTFVQGIAQGWGSLNQVTSPTFVLVNVYERPDGKKIHHLDAYRLENQIEAIDLDLEHMQETGVLLIEWADKISDVLPDSRFWVELSWNDVEHRDMRIKGVGKRYQQLLEELRHQVYGVRP